MATSSPDRTEALSPVFSTSAVPIAPAPTATPERGDSFTFPAYTSFPPFYTLQPNLTTRARQLALWSSLITSYCAYHRIFRLALSSLPQDLFINTTIHRSLNQNDVRMVLEWMSKSENGGRAEWIASTTRNEKSSTCFVYWRTLSEWADMIYGWVDETGQKGTVLTFYELRESDAVRSKEWRDMDEEMMKKVLNILVKRSKAQVFGQEENAGIKIF